MARSPKQPKSSKKVDALKHDAATRKNIPTAEMESFFRRDEDHSPMPPKHYPRPRPLAEGTMRTDEEPSQPTLIWNGARITITAPQMKELAETGTLTLSDAQLVWRGKDKQDWSDLVVNVPPLYIQEKIHPKAIIDDLKCRTAETREARSDAPDMFADFNGLEPDQRAEFYQHDQHWSNRMILGDSLQVMASLVERESLRGKVQCIYFDPPYGIKFNSNWQASTQNLEVKDGKQNDISREPEQVKAFRDTWKDGIHSYLAYLRDRLTAMRDLLTESGSMFVQIGDENVHRVRAVMDEVFGAGNCVSEIVVQKTYGFSSDAISNVSDYILWFAKSRSALKWRALYEIKPYVLGEGNAKWLMLPDFTYRGVPASEKASQVAPKGAKPYNPDNLISQGRASDRQPLTLRGLTSDPWERNSHWKANYPDGVNRLVRSERVHLASNSFRYRRFHGDFSFQPYSNIWTDTGTGNFTDTKIYIVQSGSKTVERCILMSTDPGDLVLDPTCGSGTTTAEAR
jgi:adenine-specific DNA-methyltransferase